ncbi:hypothetical protein B0T18DRAFT_401246 [Schizothecium vesticola]|uniref:Uncharacterized protein n=1 Tax=Schizothecium vesticola TaxID=314040 RepID=A0AA40F4N2_9PEZI|nr:hypothetical protein B0T18DRAFT_401246 [Schizothecium vesticola]
MANPGPAAHNGPPGRDRPSGAYADPSPAFSRPFLLQEALPYSPFTSIIPFDSSVLHQPTPPKEKIAKLGYGPAAKTALLLMPVKLEEACAKGGQVTGEGAYNWTSVIRMTRKLVSNRLSGLWQARPPPGYVKISWICVSSRPQPPCLS